MHKSKKIAALLLSLMLIMSLALSACSEEEKATASKAEKDEYVVKLGLGRGLCEAATMMAIVNGYFEEEGVKFTVINFGGTTDIPTLISSGQLDATQFMLPQLGILLNSGLDVYVATGLHKGCLVIVVPADSSVGSVQDLKGKRIGVPGLGSTPMIISKRVLTRAGINATDEASEVEFLAFNAGDLPVALANGSVDAIALIEPMGSVLVENGAGKIIFNLGTDEDYKNEDCCVMALNKDFAEKHPDVAAKYVRALQKSCEFVRNNPEKAAKLEIENNMVNLGHPELNARLLDSYQYKASVSGGREALRANLTDLQKLGMLNKEFNVDDLVKRISIHLPGVPDSIDLDI